MSKFLDMIVKEKSLEDKINNIVSKAQGKKILVYGTGLSFEKLNKKFDLTKRLNIVAFSDKKYETKNLKTLFDIKTIEPNEIKELDFDYAIITLERANPVIKFLNSNLNIEKDKIIALFEEEFRDEFISYNYLEQFKFQKHLEKLNKKLKGKSIILYGAGVFLEAIKKYYDLSKLNIIGISDKRFDTHGENETFLGYKVYSKEEIKELKPDYVLVAVKYYVPIIEEMYYYNFKDTLIKIKPLVRKPFFTLLKEIWG